MADSGDYCAPVHHQANPQYFLHPITLEATMFAHSLELLHSTCSTIDKELLASLNRISIIIDFLKEKKISECTSTPDRIYISPFDIKGMEKQFRCRRCKRGFATNTQKAVEHVLWNYPLPKCNIERKNPQSPTQDAINGSPDIGTDEPQTKKPNDDFDKQRLDSLVETIVQLPPYPTLKEQIKIADKLKYIPEYQTLENDLSALLKDCFPSQNIRIYRFGSRENGLSNCQSDLDLFIDIDNEFHVYVYKSVQANIKMKRIEKALFKAPHKWKHILNISEALVPIIKVQHKLTFLQCDISINNGLGVMNDFLLKYFFAEQPICRWLCLYMKNFFKMTQMQHFKSFAISLMVIFYLQVKNLLPSVKRLQSDLREFEKVTIGPWLCSINNIKFSALNIPMVDINNKSLKYHLKEFFQYYSYFNFKRNAICTYIGDAVSKATINAEMPTGFKLNVERAVVVQSPFKMDHNVTGAITKLDLKKFLHSIRHAERLLKNFNA